MAALEAQPVPVDEADLEAAAAALTADALRRFDVEKFGNEAGASAGSLRSLLQSGLAQARGTLARSLCTTKIVIIEAVS